MYIIIYIKYIKHIYRYIHIQAYIKHYQEEIIYYHKQNQM